MTRPDPPHLRRNFNALVVDVTLFALGIAFLDHATVLPVIVRELGGGETVLGAMLALRQAALYLPPLLSGHHLQGRLRLMPHLRKVSLLGRLSLLPAALSLWLWGARQPGLALVVFAAAYLVSWAGDGAGMVPWAAVIGRAIPADRRGRLFATIQALSSVVRLGAGLVVTPLLARLWAPFPTNALLLVLLGFAALMGSWVGLACIREPDPPADAPPPEPRPPFAAYLRRLPALMRRNPDLRRLAATQVLGLACMSSIPFIAHGARSLDLTPPAALAPLLERLGAEGGTGVFLLAMTAGQLVSAPVWGRLTDRYGPRRSLVGLMALGTLAPVAALVGLLWGGGMAPYLAAYFLLGAIADTWSTTLNYLLELVHRSGENETDAIALMNVASVPALLLPLTAGLLTKVWGLPAPFVGATVLVGIAFLLARSLPETRAPHPAG